MKVYMEIEAGDVMVAFHHFPLWTRPAEGKLGPEDLGAFISSEL
jgi:hypothetical protein